MQQPALRWRMSLPAATARPRCRHNRSPTAAMPRRHKRLPMVCQRWNELCYSPELLGELSVEIEGSLTDFEWDGPKCSDK